LPNYFPQIEKVARLFHRSISLRATGTDHEFEAQDAMFADSATQELFAFETL
jgi:putative ABC transport system permease protein